MGFFRRQFAAMAGAFALLIGATAKATEQMHELQAAMPKLEPRAPRRHKAKKKDRAILFRSRNKYRAHQGDRECARRRGGLAAWGKPDVGAARGVCESVERVAPWAAKARLRLSDAVGILGWVVVALGALAAMAALGGRT